MYYPSSPPCFSFYLGVFDIYLQSGEETKLTIQLPKLLKSESQ